MLKVNFQNIHGLTDQNSISKESLLQARSKMDDLYNQILNHKQGFLDLPNASTEEIKTFTQQVTSKYKNIVILGIGGSMLGPKCILDALYTYKDGLKVYCLDNIDPDQISIMESRIDLKDTLFLVQTKSGTTPETIAQYLYFKKKVEAENLDFRNHFVFVTDPEKGYLRNIANQEQVPCFEIPQNVGGRFSVLTPVGLLVASLVGINIDEILSGAKYSTENLLNDAYDFAYINYELSAKGKNVHVIMPYATKLKTFSEWCVQLISESIGKKRSVEGNIDNVGVTPLPAVGATDQHSQLQLFAEGPNDKLITFIEVEKFDTTVAIPANSESSLSYLNNHSFNDLIKAEFYGTRESLTEADRPNITISIEKLNGKSLGALFMFFEVYTAFFGEMLGVNTFNQPGVERSKVLARENILKF